MAEPEIEILISPDGKTVKIEVINASGAECLRLTERIEFGLGRVTGRTLTPDHQRVKERVKDGT